MNGAKVFSQHIVADVSFLQFCDVLKRKYGIRSNNFQLQRNCRCCKRDSWLAILAAKDFTREQLGVAMQRSVPTCDFCAQNNQCIGKRCPFAPVNRRKPKVAFICVHNACRSQIAEALGKALAADTFESYSAGTETKPRINPDAVRLMKQVCGIDMEATQHSKLLSDLPAVDIVVTTGCNVQCPTLPCRHREDWGLADPAGQSDAVFLATIEQIREKVPDLRRRVTAYRDQDCIL